MKKDRRSAIIRLIILGSIIIIVPIVLYFTCSDTLFNTEWLSSIPNRLKNEPVKAALILLGLQILQIIICILPGQPIQFAASYLFGTFGGYLISITGAVIGAVITYKIASYLGASAVSTIFGEEKVADYRKKINSGKGLLLVLIVYLIPGLPKDLVAYVAGISDMRMLPFIIISSVGRTPGMMGSLLIGSFFSSKNYKAILILTVICLIILFICWLKRAEIISLMDTIEEKDIEREAKNHGKTTE